VSDLGRLRIKADLLEKPILPIRISDRAVVRLGAGEDRYLDPAEWAKREYRESGAGMADSPETQRGCEEGGGCGSGPGEGRDGNWEFFSVRVVCRS
jgi:hypothetical protein